MHLLKTILTAAIIAVTIVAVDVKLLPWVYGYLQKIGMS